MTKFTVDDFKDICNSHGLIVDECVDSHGWTDAVMALKQGINEIITKFIVADGWIKFWIKIDQHYSGYIRTCYNGERMI